MDRVPIQASKKPFSHGGKGLGPPQSSSSYLSSLESYLCIWFICHLWQVDISKVLQLWLIPAHLWGGVGKEMFHLGSPRPASSGFSCAWLTEKSLERSLEASVHCPGPALSLSGLPLLPSAYISLVSYFNASRMFLLRFLDKCVSWH